MRGLFVSDNQNNALFKKINFIELSFQNVKNLRENLVSTSYDIVIFDDSIKEEEAFHLAQYVVLTTPSSVMMLLREKPQIKEEVYIKQGIQYFIRPYPLDKLKHAISLSLSCHYRILNLYKENANLMLQMDTLRLIHRAKCVLISHYHMSEEQAHRYIEKHAMNLRCTKRQVAEDILNQTFH